MNFKSIYLTKHPTAVGCFLFLTAQEIFMSGATFPLFLVQTPHDGLVLMTVEEAACSLENGGGRLYGLVQTDSCHMRPITRQEKFDIQDRADEISGSK